MEVYIKKDRPVKTAAYCRVSTEKEVQEGSYEIQVTYFTNLIESDPNMVFAGIYGDKGKSGLRADTRPGLQQLLEDCRAGKIEQILSKSISRFARNMGECAEMVRELRNLGINIIFEKEKLDTADDRCDLILNILSAIAQEESHSISQNVIRSREQHVLQGKPLGKAPFGYRNTENHRWVIHKEEAQKVKKAFEMAGKGKNYTEIRLALDRMEKDYKWSQQRVRYMLTNPVYKGDYYSHKTVCLVPGKSVRNKGYRDRYYIKGHHKAIVSPELFDRVQELVENGELLTHRRKHA